MRGADAALVPGSVRSSLPPDLRVCFGAAPGYAGSVDRLALVVFGEEAQPTEMIKAQAIELARSWGKGPLGRPVRQYRHRAPGADSPPRSPHRSGRV